MNRFLLSLFLMIISSSFAQLSFQDNATTLGVGISYGDSTFGGGVSFCDFDGDGWDDITYATTNGEEIAFFKNNNGTFTQVDFGINDVYRVKQVIWIDFDNDGDKDFFTTSISGFNKFYKNDGSMTFSDITSSCGLFTDDKRSYGASFGDIDNDGDLDVFISNRDDISETDYSYLYRNDDGTFVNVTESAGLSLESQLSFCSAFFDYDNDGDQDIYVANDKSSNINRLYQNNGDATFTDVSVTSGAGIGIDAMSTTIGDYNNDGWFDIYVTNSPGGNHHLKNNGDGTFTNVADIAGTAFQSVGWGAVFLDADNDSDLDIYVSSSEVGAISGRLPSAFYENQGDDTYLIPTSIGFANDTRISYCNAIGDFDNDGFPDIIVMNDTENNFLWKNTTTNSNSWLKVNLQGAISNKDGIGSKIEVLAEGKTQYRYTLNGEGYLSQNSNTEFFGLKDATTIESVKVTWLSGTVDVLTNVAVNQSITIVEGENTLSTETVNLNIFSIYPNPSNASFNIELNDFNSKEILSVYDVFGRKIKSKKLKNQKSNVNLDGFSNGVYFFNISSENGNSIKKVIYKK